MQALLSGPRLGLDEDLLREALSLRYGATLRRGVDLFTLDGERRPAERLRWTEWTATWAYRAPSETGGQQLAVSDSRRRLDITLAGPQPGNLNLAARRLQVYTEVRMRGGVWARFNHGLFEPQNPGVADDGVLVTRNLQCVDKSGRWASKTLGQPVVVSGTEPVVPYVRASLTAVFGETDFAIAASTATLGEQRIFEASTTYLEFYSALLVGIGHDELTADEEGRPASQPMSALAGRGAETTYGAGQGKILTAGQVDPLLPTLPNVLVFSARQGPSLGNAVGNGLVIRRNERTGPASLLARGGYEVEQTIDVPVDSQVALEAVADAEQERYFAGGGLRFRGQVGINPLAGERDVIAIRLPRLEITDGLWVTTQWVIRGRPGEVDPAGALMDLSAERRVA